MRIGQTLLPGDPGPFWGAPGWAGFGWVYVALYYDCIA